MNKKAALNLGISTVVVMVIAMVVIGAGVSFIRTMFGESTEALIGTFDLVGGIGLNPTRDEPLVLEVSSIAMNLEDRKTLRAAFYNRNTDTVDVDLSIGSCNPHIDGDDPSSDGSDHRIILQSVKTPVGGQSSVGFTFLIETEMDGLDEDDPRNFVCSIRAVESNGIGTEVRVLASRSLTISLP